MKFAHRDTINVRDFRKESSYYKIDVSKNEREYKYYYRFTEEDYQNAVPIVEK